MALTVSGLNYTQISACDATTNWTVSGSASTDADIKKEGSYALCAVLKAAYPTYNTAVYTPGGYIDLSGTKHLRMWFLTIVGGLLETFANGGVQFSVTDGVNTAYWTVLGKDTYVGGWVNLVLDVSRAADSGTKPTNMAQCTAVGFRMRLSGGAKNTTTTWWDNLCVCDGLVAYGEHDTGAITINANSAGTYTRTSGDYTTDGFKPGMSIVISGYTNSGNNGSKIISTVTTTVITVLDSTGMVTESGTGDERVKGFFDMDDIYAKDNATTLGIGIVRKIAGVYFLTGAIRIGDTGGTATKFQDLSAAWAFENRLVSSTLYKIDAVDSGGGSSTTEFYFGRKSGTNGVQGCFIRVESATQTPKFSIDGKTDTDVDNFHLYGSTFYGGGTMDLPLSATDVETRNCTFESCGVVTPQTSKVEYANFINATTYGITLSSTTLNVKYCYFINPTTSAVRITTAGTYTFVDMVFSGTTGSGPYDVENTTASAVTIQNSGTSNAQYANNTGGGTTSFESVKTLTLTNVVTGSRCYLNESPATIYTSASSGNDAGDSTFVVQEALQGDCPSSGTLIMEDVSTGLHHRMRFASKTASTKTFTMITKISGTTTSAGGSTQIKDSGATFLSQDILYGDICRNSTDGSWAQVVSIDSNIQVTTTALQGGSDNTWASGDGYEFHTLPVTYTGSDMAITPWMDKVASSPTVQSSINYQSDTLIVGRVRYSSGATRYRDYPITGTFSTSGFTLRVDQAEDTIAP